MNCTFNVSIGEINAASGRFDKMDSMIFFDSFRKSNNVAYNSFGAHTNNPIHHAGDYSTNAIHMDVDTTTDTTQHRIELHNQSQTITNNVQILCTLSYTMVRK